MALFIAGLALNENAMGNTHALDVAKIGVLVASAISGILGLGLLVYLLPSKKE